MKIFRALGLLLAFLAVLGMATEASARKKKKRKKRRPAAATDEPALFDPLAGDLNSSTSSASSSPRLDATAALGGFPLSVGGNVWVVIPIVPDGLVQGVDDSLDVEVGGSVSYTSYSFGFCSVDGVGLAGLGGLRWAFNLTDEWTLFGKVKPGVVFFTASSRCAGAGASVGGVGFGIDGGVGGYYHFSDDMALRFDLGYFGFGPGLSVGISLPI